jgi:hypothetical protein
MKKLMMLLGIVASFVLGITIHPRSAQAQFGNSSVRIYRQSTIIYGENSPLQIHGEIMGFSCTAEHDPKSRADVECFILSK